MTTPVTVERVLDEEHSIIVTLDPAQVVDHLAARLVGLSDQLRLLRVLDPNGDNATIREGARRKLLDAVGPALQVTLDRAQAAQLVEDLEVAAREPVPCVVSTCTDLADDDYCARHLDAGAGRVRAS